MTQEKFEPILVLAENGGSVTAYGADNELTVNLRASVAWKVEGTTGWCGVSQSKERKHGRETPADRQRRRAPAQCDADLLFRNGVSSPSR